MSENKRIVNGVSIQIIEAIPFNDDELGFFKVTDPIEAIVSINGTDSIKVISETIKGIMIYELEPIGFDDPYYEYFHNCQEDKTNMLFRMYIGAHKPQPVNI